MICKNCGWQSKDNSRFCEKCGYRLAPDFVVTQTPQPAVNMPRNNANGKFAAPPVASTWPPVQMPPVQKKKKTGLIVGLAAGGAMVIIAVVLIAVLSAASPVEGIWYSEDLGVVLEFERGGLVVSYTPEGQDEGNYTFSSHINKGVITADEADYDFRLDGRRITIQDVGTFEKAGSRFDVEDFLDNYPEIPNELKGTWYESEGYGIAIFYPDGDMELTIMDVAYEASYTFNSGTDSGVITYADVTSEFTCNGNTLIWEDCTWTLDYVEQIEVDWDSVLDN